MVPLFPGIPGGAELVVLLLVFVVLVLPLVLVGAAVALGVKVLGGDDTGERDGAPVETRVEDLERRVEALESDERRERDDG